MAWHTITITATDGAYVDYSRPTQHVPLSQSMRLGWSLDAFLVRFVLPNNVKDKKLDDTDAKLTVYYKKTQSTETLIDWHYASASFRSLTSGYDPATVTYIDYQDIRGGKWSGLSDVSNPPYITNNIFSLSADGQNAFTNGLDLRISNSGTETYTTASSFPPTLTLNYSDDTSFYSVGRMSPSTTYKNKDTRFSWALVDGETGFALTKDNFWSTGVFEPPTQTSATLKWRTAAGQTEHSVSAGTNNYVTVPANTFTTDTVEWMVTATYSNGITRSTDWRTLSTVDTIPTVIGQRPRNTTIDGSTETLFKWFYSNDSGSAPTGYTLQTSTDGSTWSTLSENLDTDAVTYTAPANTFGAGNLYWRVKGYNVDGVGSEWSAPLTNIVIAPPLTPSVSVATTTPLPIITWQTTGQQGFEIEMDGVSSGVKFGTSQTYQWTEALSDGEHSVRVRAQNIYGVWSEWGGATFTVANVPGDDITLTATTIESVSLNWSTEGTYDRYVVYRDDVKIAETTTTSYNDYKSVGTVTYTVRGIYGDYYTMSNAVSATVIVDGMIIRSEDDNEWMQLKLVATSDRHTAISHTQNVSYQHYSGATYPMATIGATRDYIYSFAVAFKDIDECKRFENLLGKVVTLKDGWQNCVTGVLDGYTIDSTRFYQSYGCTIRQVE